MIKQEVLKTFRNAHLALAEKEAKLKLIKAKLSDVEVELISRLEKGERVQRGLLVAGIEHYLGRANVKWKDVVEALKGKTYVEEVLQDADRPEKKRLLVKEKRGRLT